MRVTLADMDAGESARRLVPPVSEPGRLLKKIMVDGRAVGWSWTAVAETARIKVLEVDPGFRGHGHGRAAVAVLERELRGRGVSRVDVDVAGVDARALRFWTTAGFAETARQLSRPIGAQPVPDDVDLVPLPDPGRRLAALIAEYAADLCEDEQLSPAEAQRVAERRLADFNPQDPRSLLCTITARGTEVGWLWAGPPRRPRPGLGWLHQIEIDEPYRGQGHATGAIAALGRDLRRRGLRSLGLNVHGANVRARRLYERLGFTLTTQQLAKDLRGGVHP